MMESWSAVKGRAALASGGGLTLFRIALSLPLSLCCGWARRRGGGRARGPDRLCGRWETMKRRRALQLSHSPMPMAVERVPLIDDELNPDLPCACLARRQHSSDHPPRAARVNCSCYSGSWPWRKLAQSCFCRAMYGLLRSNRHNGYCWQERTSSIQRSARPFSPSPTLRWKWEGILSIHLLLMRSRRPSSRVFRASCALRTQTPQSSRKTDANPNRQ